MKGLIVYGSKYGATQKYAGYIGNTLKVPIESFRNIAPENLVPYDYLILGSSVYIGKLLMKKWLRKNLQAIRQKKIFFFLVSATPSSEKQKLEKIISDNIPQEIVSEMQPFFLHGRLVRNQLNLIDGILLKLGAKANHDKEAGRKMLQDFDDVKYPNTVPLTEAVRSYSQLHENYSSIPIK